MPKLTVDGIEVTVPANSTVLQACEAAGKEIPRFCYHERLSIAGNCRMCLVEMEKSPKPIASCAMPAAENMVIHTDTPMVKKAREGVLEFLLINHPLDCPICDQGGECDLQDETMAYGHNTSRLRERKRAVREKFMGPLIKTVMTRCIHCTRCIRFATEIAGVPEIGLIGRGEHMEITTYLDHAVSSELSGNVIDLCPVGALTSKPFAFAARSWELRRTESIDVLDALGSNIRVDARGREVMRVLPRLNEDINEEWISDKTRFAYDGLKRQRLDQPYVRRDGKLKPATWAEAFSAIAGRLKGLEPKRIAALVGDLVDAEAIVALKDLMQNLGVANLDARQDGAKLPASPRGAYLFNTTIAGIERADAVLLIGSNPRVEGALVNARIRKRWIASGIPVANIGPALDLTYPVEELGNDPKLLAAIAEGRHPFAAILREAKNPMLILGQGALARADGAIILGLARRIAETTGMIGEDWNGFNVLHHAAARVAALDLGCVPGTAGLDRDGILQGAVEGTVEVLYLLGVDEIDMQKLGKAFVIYQGTHGDAGAHRADVILPGAAYTEKNATWVSTEGRVQRGQKAVPPPGQAREDWAILRALSEALGAPLPYDDLGAVRTRLAAVAPHFAKLEAVERAPWGDFGAVGTVTAVPFELPIGDYFLTDPICRASTVMAECSALAVARREKATGTHG
jgi:NADH-quinone oxidoreductase subunit G